MRRLRPLALLALAAAARPAAAQQTPPAEDYHHEYAALIAQRGRVPDARRLHRLFEVNWRYRMHEFPEFATYVGYPGQNARWTDRSPEAIARRKRELEEPLRVLRSIDRSRLSAADRLNYDLFRRGLELAREGARFKDEYLPVNQLGGAQQDLAQVLALAPARSVADYEDMLARLRAVPTVVDQEIALMRRGVEEGVTPPRVVLRDVPDQVRNQIVDDPLASPLLRPFGRFPVAVAEADRDRLRREAARIYTERVRPAFERLLRYLTGEYIPRARESVGLGALPDGAAWYAYRVRRYTTTDLDPERIHQLGLAEVKRIRAALDSVIASTGFPGSFPDFTRFLRTDPRFFFTDSAALLQASRDLAKRIDPELIKLFGKLPRLPYGVVPVPAYAAKSQTTAYYEPGSLKAGRPGNYFVNWYDLKSRPKWEMEALTLHEAVPGHHLQLALADELEGIPDFRKYADYTAFVEGWGLYAESLGPELGLYTDPYAKFGQLTYEMWRAIRLVLDTGIHAKGWTRDQAMRFFRENSAKTEHDIEVEVDRYIVWPGQALAYKLGELKFKELRAYAAKELGPGFDLRAFHDRVLGQGPLPLDVLDAETRRWVEAGKAAVSHRPSSTRRPLSAAGPQ